MAATANRANDQNGRERSRQYYIDAITATNAAIRDPESVQQDDTLVAVHLLACYEVSDTWYVRTRVGADGT